MRCRIPIASSIDRITVEYKEFGVGVSFTPTVLSDDRIHLDVTTEVSQIDFGLGTAVSGLPRRASARGARRPASRSATARPSRSRASCATS